MRSLINGLPGDSVSAADRGLAYGDGLFETVRVIDGQPILLDLHLARLNQGCERLGLDLDAQCLQKELQTLCSGSADRDQVLKIIVTRAMGGVATNLIIPNRLIAISVLINMWLILS